MRVLFVSHVPPFDPSSGGRQRSRMICDVLSERGEVDLVLLRNSYNHAVITADHISRSPFPVCAVIDEPDPPLSQTLRTLRALGAGPIARKVAYHLDAGARLLEPDPRARQILGPLIRANDYDLIVARDPRGVAVSGLLKTGRVLLDLDDHPVALLESRIPHVDPFNARPFAEA